MKPAYPLLLLYFIVHSSVVGYTQKTYDRARHDKKFSKRNRSISASYKGANGKGGRNGLYLFHMFVIRGSDAGPGGEGPCLQVNVYAIPTGDSAILAIDITNDIDKTTNHYYVNPRRGKLTISSEGGSGGYGGRRDDGTLLGGYDGGNGGMGGTINITYDSSALPYVDCQCIIALNRGGIGGDGGAGNHYDHHDGSTYDGGTGNYGLPGAPGPAIYIKDTNGNIVKMITLLKY